jgi:serine phosphatase RsbU (regulator of sigma subunit)
MVGVATAFRPSELTINNLGQERHLELVEQQYRLGRGLSNELAFPEDARLSREHLVLRSTAAGWELTDLNSSNGTRVNGQKISGTVELRNGDQITAGSLHLSFRTSGRAAPPQTIVEFLPRVEQDLSVQSITLQAALQSGVRPDRLNDRHVTALLQAGRELASYRTLDQLFDLILDLSVKAVGGSRGVLMISERDSLTIRSSRGEDFRISSRVRDRVLAGESLLIQDTQFEKAWAQMQSIVASNVRSMLAVPLQTERGVLGLIYVDSPDRVAQFGPQDLSLLTVMSNIAGIRIEHARLLEVEQAERQLARELEHASQIQNRLLPSAPPCCPELDLAGHNMPCRKVGGDYYDFWAYPDGRTAIVIADVSGKGMPAALLMANLQAICHVLFEQPEDLVDRVCRLNRAVATNTLVSSFITFFTAIVDSRSNNLTYCNAGHNPPLLLRADGSDERLGPTGMVLGLIKEAPYSAKTVPFCPGDALLLFSDGVTEACSPGSTEEFGEDRLLDVLRRSSLLPAQEIVEEVKSSLASYLGGEAAADDVTLVVVRRQQP